MDLLPSLLRFGNDHVPVLIIDGFTELADGAFANALQLGPFPAPDNNYPGRRRIIEERDEAAFAQILELLSLAKPYIAGAFDLDGFDLVEASFSLVTTPPERLLPMQRTPHFDTLDENFFAALLYLTPCTGTGFYRHRETGIEFISQTNINRYANSVMLQEQPAGYICGDNDDYEMIGSVEGLKGRLVAYPGPSLHAGQIPPDMVLQDDVRSGRLTANIFLRGW